MAEATTGFTPPSSSLPDEIVTWEILVRLPPKPLLRCRAVCRAWHHATSTNDFLLAHHAHQPTLPLICGHDKYGIDILSLDHWEGVPMGDDKLHPVARLDDDIFTLEASCDGLLLLADNYYRFSICNPATRQYARLKHFNDFKERHYFTFLGMYPHSPTGEYRLIGKIRFGNDLDFSYYAIFTLGSSESPRDIECPHEWERYSHVSILFNGSMHWYAGHMITVLDTIAESFRKMCTPIVCYEGAEMFESGGKLGIWRFNEEATNMDIWMMQDYKGEVWTFKYRVEFPIEELAVQFGQFRGYYIVVVPSWDGDVFGLVSFGVWLHQMIFMASWSPLSTVKGFVLLSFG